MKMIKKIKALLDVEQGVAMITVILVGASLTVVASTAAVVTVQDFRSGAADRRGTEALSSAESGIDRLMLALRSDPNVNWERLNEAGCELEPITVPQGDLGEDRYYNAYLTVYNNDPDPANRLPDVGDWEPGDDWAPYASNDTTSEACLAHDGVEANSTEPVLFAITSTGDQPLAKRVVRQIVRVTARGLPLAMFAESANVQGGNPSASSISLITRGDVDGRENLRFDGPDAFYQLGDFFLGLTDTMAAQSAPAAVHALGSINCSRTVCGTDRLEHPGPLNCFANRRENNVNNGQSQWDQSGRGGSLSGLTQCTDWSGSPSGLPPSSYFGEAEFALGDHQTSLTPEDYTMLRQAARNSGLYCSMSASNNSGNCTRAGGTSFTTNGTISDAEIAGLPNNFVAYFDYPSAGVIDSQRWIRWSAEVSPCSTDLNMNRSVIIVVRYGHLELAGRDEIVGAFFVEDGTVSLRGSGNTFKIHGTILADRIDVGGNAQIELSDCWVANLMGIFLNIRPLAWSEVDR